MADNIDANALKTTDTNYSSIFALGEIDPRFILDYQGSARFAAIALDLDMGQMGGGRGSSFTQGSIGTVDFAERGEGVITPFSGITDTNYTVTFKKYDVAVQRSFEYDLFARYNPKRDEFVNLVRDAYVRNVETRAISRANEIAAGRQVYVNGKAAGTITTSDLLTLQEIRKFKNLMEDGKYIARALALSPTAGEGLMRDTEVKSYLVSSTRAIPERIVNFGVNLADGYMFTYRGIDIYEVRGITETTENSVEVQKNFMIGENPRAADGMKKTLCHFPVTDVIIHKDVMDLRNYSSYDKAVFVDGIMKRNENGLLMIKCAGAE